MKEKAFDLYNRSDDGKKSRKHICLQILYAIVERT
jgi:hypothetical protein